MSGRNWGNRQAPGGVRHCAAQTGGGPRDCAVEQNDGNLPHPGNADAAMAATCNVAALDPRLGYVKGLLQLIYEVCILRLGAHCCHE